MTKFLKKLLYRPVKLTCGTVNTETGETTTGYRTFDGDIVYKKDKPVPIWSQAVYLGLITRTHLVVNHLTGRTRKEERKYPMYRETNMYNETKHRYFVDMEGRRHYIHTDAYEHDNEIIFL